MKEILLYFCILSFLTVTSCLKLEERPTKTVLEIEILFEKGEEGEAIKELREVVKKEPNNERAEFLLAKFLILTGDSEGEIVLRELLEKNSYHLEALQLKALFAEENGDVEEALSIWHRTTYIREELGKSYYQLARLYYQEGEKEKAVTMLHSALDVLKAGDIFYTSILALLEEVKNES